RSEARVHFHRRFDEAARPAGKQSITHRNTFNAEARSSGLRAPEVLQPVERILDAPAQLVETLAEAERLVPVAAIWNVRLGSALIQFLAQFGAVVSLVAEQPFRRLHSADQALRDRAIMRFAAGQQDGNKAPFSICECVNLRVAPAARAANSLLL